MMQHGPQGRPMPLLTAVHIAAGTGNVTSSCLYEYAPLLLFLSSTLILPKSLQLRHESLFSLSPICNVSYCSTAAGSSTLLSAFKLSELSIRFHQANTNF
jgi:hypothetical protein